MSYNIIASFAQPANAEKARTALIERGLTSDDLRLTEHHEHPEEDHGDYDLLSSLLDCSALGLGFAGLGVIATVFNPDLKMAAIQWGVCSVIIGVTVGALRGRSKMREASRHDKSIPTSTLRIKLGGSLSEQETQSLLHDLGAAKVATF